jgi:hypothetical protein
MYLLGPAYKALGETRAKGKGGWGSGMKNFVVVAGLCEVAQLQCDHPLQPGRSHTHQHVEQNRLASEGHEGIRPSSLNSHPTACPSLFTVFRIPMVVKKRAREISGVELTYGIIHTFSVAVGVEDR